MYKKRISIIVLVLTSIFSPAVYSKNIVFDNKNHILTWKNCHAGSSGAGASVMPMEGGKVTVRYVLPGAGDNATINLSPKFAGNINSFMTTLKSDADCIVTAKVEDSSGNVFCGKSIVLKRGKAETIICNIVYDKRFKEPQFLFKSFVILVSRTKSQPATGSLEIIRSEVDVNGKNNTDFSGKDAATTACGWDIHTTWIGSILKITAANKLAKNAVLSLTFPQAARNPVSRCRLSDKRQKYELYYNPPLDNNSSTLNKYRILMQIQAKDKTQTSIVLPLLGCNSKKNNLGGPISSINIKSSSVGTNTHFSFAAVPIKAFSRWRDYKKIINSISACGIKWIRDGCRVVKDENGRYQVSRKDLEWMKYAVSKKLNIILIVYFNANMSIDECKAIAEAIERDTLGLVNVFELGNEPHNANWRKKYPGSWNGWEKGGTVSKWVKMHLKYTNALADHFRALRPNAVIIGLGACSPTNFHYLNLGVSKNLNGVVDHPYSYAIPPEKIPYGHSFVKRDGIVIGDKNCTFAGLIKSYMKHFKKTGTMRSLWMTEFGYSTFWFDNKNYTKNAAGFSEKAQAVYLIRRLLESFTLPIEVSCQYDFIDDYQLNQFAFEANFGLLRADFSPKLSYYAIQRLNSLFNGYKYASDITAIVEKAPLHKSCMRLFMKWSRINIVADNSIKAFIFENANLDNEKILAVWSVQPYNTEFNNRSCVIRVKGLSEFSGKPVAIDLISGLSYDLTMQVDGNDLLFNNLILKNHPIVIKLFQDK